MKISPIRHVRGFDIARPIIGRDHDRHERISANASLDVKKTGRRAIHDLGIERVARDVIDQGTAGRVERPRLCRDFSGRRALGPW